MENKKELHKKTNITILDLFEVIMYITSIICLSFGIYFIYNAIPGLGGYSWSDIDFFMIYSGIGTIASSFLCVMYGVILNTLRNIYMNTKK
jgi:hypothetical protein